MSYYRSDIKDNGYAHPIEGVVALVDMIEGKVINLVDEKEIVPIPKTKRNYNRDAYKKIHNGAIGDIRAAYSSYYTGSVYR